MGAELRQDLTLILKRARARDERAFKAVRGCGIVDSTASFSTDA